MQRLKLAIAMVLFLLGILAIGTAARTTNRSHTRDGRLITEVCIGLADSPLYVSHREAPVGGVSDAIARRQDVVIVADTRWNLFSRSGLLALFGAAATTWALVTFVRVGKRE